MADSKSEIVRKSEYAFMSRKKISDGAPCLEKLTHEKYEEVVSSFKCDDDLNDCASDENLEDRVRKYVKACLSKPGAGPELQLEVLATGVAALELFVQCNWTGPLTKQSPYEVCPWLQSSGRSPSETHEDILNYLVLDGESCFSAVQNIEYLFLATVILHKCLDQLSELETSKWWSLRCLFVHQQILEEKSPTIYKKMMQLIPQILQQEPLMTDDSNKDMKVEFLLEGGKIHAYYSEVLKSNDYFQLAQKLANLDVSLKGALGKRTRYQIEDLAQLTLHIQVDEERKRPENDQDRLSIENLPKDLKLDDDLLLNQIKFKNEEEQTYPLLSSLEQAIVLGIYNQLQKSQPKDELIQEELMPYLNCILSNPRDWSLHFSALNARCKLESLHSRRVERSMMQTQVLVDCVPAENPRVSERLKYFYCARVPPKWEVEAQLADLLMSMGAVNSALDVYLRLQLWEDVITCYNRLQLRHKAAEIIKQELEKKETVKMWCLLGDATDDPECYSRAWELSNHKSARAQRHWGFFFYHKRQYAESIPHFQQSLNINSLQGPLWLRLAFAALEEENWELCATAYRRFCTLDSDSFEAWNNLSKAYIKMGQKARAWKALQEAVKCDYNQWKVWDNLMVVSTDCGEFEEVIRSYHCILNLKEKHVDVDVLSILVKAIANNLPDNHGVPAGRLRKRALELFGRLTSQVTTNSEVWHLYAKLAASEDEKSPETIVKVSQYLQKAHRCATQSVGWDKDLASCKSVLRLSNGLADAYIAYSRSCTNPNQASQMLSSARLSLKGVITKIKQQHADSVTKEVPEELREDLQVLEGRLEEISAQAT